MTIGKAIAYHPVFMKTRPFPLPRHAVRAPKREPQ